MEGFRRSERALSTVGILQSFWLGNFGGQRKFRPTPGWTEPLGGHNLPVHWHHLILGELPLQRKQIKCRNSDTKNRPITSVLSVLEFDGMLLCSGSSPKTRWWQWARKFYSAKCWPNFCWLRKLPHQKPSSTLCWACVLTSEIHPFKKSHLGP